MVAKSTVRTRASAAKPLMPSDKPIEGSDILDPLKREHDEVKKLLADLQDAESASARKSLVKSIKAALVPHTKAEEKVVYDAVISTTDADAETDGYEGYLEHEWASKTLERQEAANRPPQSTRPRPRC